MLSPGGVAPGPPSGAGDRPRTTAVDRRSTPSARATDKNLCRCFGAAACRVFPYHLITSRGECAHVRSILPRAATALRQQCSSPWAAPLAIWMPRGVPKAAKGGKPGSHSPSASAQASAVRAIGKSVNKLHASAPSAPKSHGVPGRQLSTTAMASPKVPTPSSYALWSGPAANAGPSKPAAQEFPASALKEWVASHNLEISRTHPDREGSPWDYIGHRFPREKSPGTAVHSTIITEGRWAAEFKVS